MVLVQFNGCGSQKGSSIISMRDGGCMVGGSLFSESDLERVIKVSSPGFSGSNSLRDEPSVEKRWLTFSWWGFSSFSFVMESEWRWI